MENGMDSEKNKNDQDQQAADPARLNAGLFALTPEKIAQTLASPEVSPQGPSSGLRLLTFYINYAGKRLSASRRKALEKAKKLLSARVTHELIEKEREQQRKVA